VPRFILTGAPGAGKTTLLRQLALEGFCVIEEAATDLIAAAQARGIPEPWTHHSFIDDITNLQKHRQLHTANSTGAIEFHDRSVFCTAALAQFLGYPVSPILAAELDRMQRESIYDPRVLFIRNLGFVVPTEIRRITFEQTLQFEAVHERIYRDLGFDLIFIEPGTVAERVTRIKAAISHP
jgi:predicted ATPase